MQLLSVKVFEQQEEVFVPVHGITHLNCEDRVHGYSDRSEELLRLDRLGSHVLFCLIHNEDISQIEDLTVRLILLRLAF
jgi:hypothetical protein